MGAEIITWQVATTIICCSISLAAFLIKYFTSPRKEHDEKIANLQIQINEVKAKVDIVSDKVTEIKKEQSVQEEKLYKKIESMEDKIDKFVDILINYFTNGDKK